MPTNQEIKARILGKMGGKVNRNRRKIMAARFHPRLRRGKKVPPLALLPPRTSDGKKNRHWWDMASQIATADAAANLDDME